MAKKVGNPWHDPETGEFTSAPGSTMRWSRLSKQGKAKLQMQAQFKTKMASGKAYGREPASVQGDEKIFINPTGTPGGSFPVYKYIKSPAAVAIQTAKAVDRDFQRAKDKAGIAEMKAALAKHLAKNKKD